MQCQFCGSINGPFEMQDMGEGRAMDLCPSCRLNIVKGELEHIRTRYLRVGRHRAKALSILHQIYDLGIDSQTPHMVTRARALLGEVERELAAKSV